MDRLFWTALVACFGICLSVAANAAEVTQAPTTEATTPAPDPAAQPTTPPPLVAENTDARCADGLDNDGDTHVDCDDQDCEVASPCAAATSATTAPAPIDETVKSPAAAPALFVPERGMLCSDRLDNNGNGEIDCLEASCRRSRYCQQQMFYTPEPPNKAPGYFFYFGFGAAFPGFRGVKATTSAAPAYPTDIPFDPDLGLAFGLSNGFMFKKWIGLAINFQMAFTGATNSEEYFLTRDDPDLYKYVGAKTNGHIGGLLRLQWPLCRFVPYVDLGVGYTFLEYRWHIYDGANTWDAISDFEAHNDGYHDDLDPTITGVRYENSLVSRHLTFAVQPGFDLYLIPRQFAIGLRAWLPLAAVNKKDKEFSYAEISSFDNITVLLGFTFTPNWREAPQMRPEYEAALKKAK